MEGTEIRGELRKDGVESPRTPLFGESDIGAGGGALWRLQWSYTVAAVLRYIHHQSHRRPEPQSKDFSKISCCHAALHCSFTRPEVSVNEHVRAYFSSHFH